MNKGFYLSLMIGEKKAEAAPQEVIDAFTSIEVTTSSGQRSGFQLSFSVTKRSPLNLSKLPEGYFDPARRVIVSVTINGLLQVLMDGVITQQQMAPSNEPGQSTLTITGEDLTRMMDLDDRTPKQSYTGQSAEDQVRKILASYPEYGFIPQVEESALHDKPDAVDGASRHLGTNLEHINLLAEQVGHVFYLEAGPRPGMNQAYWGPEKKKGQAQPALIVNSDAHTNVESLGFTFDGFLKSQFSFDVLEDGSGKKTTENVQDINRMNPPMGEKIPQAFRKQKLAIPDKYGANRARKIAEAKAAQSADVITGTGQLDVFRYGRVLQARQLVAVRGAGKTYDGLYYVRSVTHTIRRGEYKQSFTLSRNALVAK